MIQRIQTIFLLLAALVGVSVFFFPLAHFSISGYSFDIFTTGIKNLEVESPLDFKINMMFHMGVLIFLILICIWAIFLYKKRVLQMKLCRFGMMASVVYVFLIFMFADTIKNRFVSKLLLESEDVQVSFKLGSILPLIMVVLLFLANWFIRKDEKLVKASDRLR